MNYIDYYLEIEFLAEYLVNVSHDMKRPIEKVVEDLVNSISNFDDLDKEVEFIMCICEKCSKFNTDMCEYGESRDVCPIVIESIEEYKHN
jgi:hypothetical protein